MIPPGLHFIYYSAVAGSTVAHEKLDFSKQQAPRTGFFTFLEKRQIVVKKWNAATEELDDGAASAEEVERFRLNLREMDRFLGPYPFDGSLKRWLSLTGKISHAVAARLDPQDGKISAASMPDNDTPTVHAAAAASTPPAAIAARCDDESNPKSNGSGSGTAGLDASGSYNSDAAPTVAGGRGASGNTLDCKPDNTPLLCSGAVLESGSVALDITQDDDVHGGGVEGAGAVAATERAPATLATPCETLDAGAAAAAGGAVASGCHPISFSAVNLRSYPPNATPAQITQCNMDRSYGLSVLLERVRGDYNQLLGELQYAFVCFEFGHVYDAFEQWKQLLILFCTCDAALRKHPHLFYELIGILHFQLKETPEDFFLDIVSRNNFLAETLQTFFEFTNAADVDPKLRERALKFKHMLEARFQWTFDGEDNEEDMPLVVDLGL